MSPLQPTIINTALQYWVLPPAAELSGHVRCYFVVDSGQRPYPFEELLIPDGHAEIVFTLAAGFDRRPVVDAEKRTVVSRSYVIGGRSHSIITGGSQRLRLVGVKLEPAFLRQIIKVPLSAFSDGTLELHVLGLPALLDLEHELALSPTTAAIARTLDRFFLQQRDRIRGGDALVGQAARFIHQHEGHGRVHAWARSLDISERTLERRFSEWIGVSPKKYARIVRFHHAYRGVLGAGVERDHLQAHLGGYYDQSHFNREFRYFTGTSPGALLNSRMSSSTAVNDHLVRHIEPPLSRWQGD
jgi:AraC-like DNA-binding protein